MPMWTGGGDAIDYGGGWVRAKYLYSANSQITKLRDDRETLASALLKIERLADRLDPDISTKDEWRQALWAATLYAREALKEVEGR